MESPPRRHLDASPSPDPNRNQGVTRRLAHAIAAKLTRRRLVLNMASRFANRRFAFAVATVSILSAKGVHIYTHLSALPVVHLLLWGYSFFAQDVALLIFLRLMLDPWMSEGPAWLRTSTMTLASVMIAYLITLSAITVTFFAVAGSEIHWRNIGLAGDASSLGMFLSGLLTLLLVLTTFLVVAWVLQDVCYVIAGMASDLIRWPLSYLFRRSSNKYSEVPQLDVELASVDDSDDEHFCNIKHKTAVKIIKLLLHVLVACLLITQAVFLAVRPNESALNFMSWTPALLPFVDFSYSSPNLDKLKPVYGTSIDHTWDNITALEKPPPFKWLPDQPTPGFEDWYEDKTHYNAAADPIKISNLGDDLLPMLKEKLADVPIRHVVLIVLESTRKDVFPVKKDGLIWNRLSNSFANKTLPGEAQAKLASLTPNANFLTGDYEDGFEHKEKKRRGGINFNNVFTTATYTIKSLVGTICGLTPLVADFNLEYMHHFYQPCLPQIFEAFNRVEDEQSKASDDFTTYKWRSSFMQSVTQNYDNYIPLMTSMGISPDNLISKEYLKSPAAKFGPVDLPDINYFGMSEIALDDYVRDAFVEAKKNKERLFMTHLTSTSHHPYAIPAENKYTPLGNGLDDLSHYMNAIGWDDWWLGRIMQIMEEEGVADETLMVFVGDHGVSIPENGILAPYYNPNIGTIQVPLVLSHPKLPAIDVNDAVVSSQILPTILDLLRETGSLSKSQKQAASDLVENYEGQSLIRPIRTSSNETEQANWHYTIINPGRAMLGVRDARTPDWHLVVPIIDNVEWHFTNLSEDPTEAHPTLGFDFATFLQSVETAHGVDAARWVEEAAFMARWWVEENGKRWRFGPYAG